MNLKNLFFDTAIGEDERSSAAWMRIQRNPTSIQIKRGNAAVKTAQTVRIEFVPSGNLAGDEGKSASSGTAVVFGIKGHSTQTDTDIKPGDRFAISGVQYLVQFVAEYPGEVQATVEVQR